MHTRDYGGTGLKVSAIGFGAGHIGGDELDESDVARLLHGAVDLGVTLIDTARGYGASEERIGRHLASRRDEIVISTKGGYGDFGVPEWTGECLTRGIEAALGRLRTDRIDVFHLHSCPHDVLVREDLLRALEDAKAAGKIRVAAYSGDDEPLAVAIGMPLFGAVQCSVNLCDQRAIDDQVKAAHARRMGVIGKRPLANACWRFAERPAGDYAETYWERFVAMGLRSWSEDWNDVALRFSAFAPGVSSVIVGTRSLDHLRSGVAALERGPLDDDRATRLREAFRAHDRGWTGQV